MLHALKCLETKLVSENLTTVAVCIVKIFSIALDILTWLTVISFVADNNSLFF